MKVYITSELPGKAVEFLRGKGYRVTVNKSGVNLTRQELIKNAKNADALISLLSDKIDREIIDNLNKCRIIANYAVGFNNIDVEYANSKGIIVTNTPDILTDATADLTMALILATTRRLFEAENFMREGKFEGWKPDLMLGFDLKGKKIGIVGMGRIGFAVAKRAVAFGMKVIYYGRSKNINAETQLNARKVSLNNLMKSADIISLHVPLTPATVNLLSSEKLDLMKENAILINTARGEVIDEHYLIKMLKKKRIFAAGFDVYSNEPNINKELFSLKNAILLPHIGSATLETRAAMAMLTAKNVDAVLSGKNPLTPVKV